MFLALLCFVASTLAAEKQDIVFLVSASENFGASPNGTFKEPISAIAKTITDQLKDGQNANFALYWGRKPDIMQQLAFTSSPSYFQEQTPKILTKGQTNPNMNSGSESGLQGAASYTLAEVFKQPASKTARILVFLVDSHIGKENDLKSILDDPESWRVTRMFVVFQWPGETCESEYVKGRLEYLEQNGMEGDLRFCDADLASTVVDLKQQMDGAIEKQKQRTSPATVVEEPTTPTSDATGLAINFCMLAFICCLQYFGAIC